MSADEFSSRARPDAHFATTHWSLVAAVGGEGSQASRAALAELCRQYWYPLYVWLRRSGTAHEDAQDLVQEFLTEVVEGKRIDRADPARGRFRTFLLASLKNFRANQVRAGQAAKRGGGQPTFSLDFAQADAQWLAEPFHEDTPDRLFDRKWALSLIEASLAALEATSQERGRQALFDRLKPYLTGAADDGSQEQIASELGMSVNAVKVALHRWREQLRESIRREIRQTVLEEGDVDRELEYLMTVLSR